MKALSWFWFVVSAVSAAGKGVVTKPGQRVTLGCGSRSSFRSLDWFHERNLILSVNGRSGTNRKGTAKILPRSKVRQGSDLEISGVKKEDAGKFLCTLDGDSHTITLFVVSVSTSPPDELQLGREGTLQCEVAGLPPDSIVQWTRPDGQLDSGTVHFNPVTLADKGRWVCGFSYDGDTFNEILDIKIKESEPLTSSPTQSSKVDHKTSCTNCVCSPPGCTDQPHRIGLDDWWLWVAIGVGSFFVVLLMVCIIVLCRRNRRKKRKFQRMMTERQSERPRKYCECNCPTAAAKPQQGRHKGKPSALPLKPLLMQ
ncbi:CD4-2 molecule, tandem duplicate 2 isoform X2 [Solea solea]|nr:CD4-2 molecule, tandem duplicate 2 isoform X2 [Solea solea]